MSLPPAHHTDLDCSCHAPSSTSRLLALFDAAAQCRAMVHLSTTDQPDAVTALRAWRVVHALGMQTRSTDGETTYRVELPNGGVIAVTEWPL